MNSLRRALAGSCAAVSAVLAAPVGAQDLPLELYRDASFPQGFAFGLSLGVSFGDYDADGWVDLHSNLSGNLWRNLAGQSWALAANLNGGFITLQYGSSFGDFNNDGLPDIVTEPRPMTCLRLFQNLGGALFIDLSTDPTLFEPRPCLDHSEGACWGDVDFDGFLDLFLPTYPPSSGGVQGNYFWRNLGPAGPGGVHAFDEQSAAAGLGIPPGHNRPEGAQFCDYDFDGDLDLYSNGALYQNRSGLASPQFGVLTATAGIDFNGVLDEGTAFLDHDLDGDYDLLVAYSATPGVTIWESRGDGTFFQTDPATVAFPLLGNEFGVSVADWDNDGDIDFSTQFAFRRNMFVETGQRGYELLIHEIPLEALVTPAISWADWDRDGDLDAAIGSIGPAAVGSGYLFANTTFDAATPLALRRHVRVRPLRDSGAVARGLETEYGASVEIEVAGETGVVRKKFNASAGGYLNQNDYALHFALPSPTEVPLGSLRLDVTADFPGDPLAGLTRVDRHVNPVLADVSIDRLVDREIAVFRSGRVRIGGCDVTPSPAESPILTTTAGGLALPTPTSGLADPVAAAPDTSVGLELIVGAQHVRINEIILDGQLETGGPFNVALWDLTTAGAPRRIWSSTLATSTRNRRSYLGTDLLVLPSRRYRLVARVTSHRTRTVAAPFTAGGVTTNGGLLYTDTDPSSGVAVAAATVDPGEIRLAVRHRPALVGVGIDLENGLPASGGTTAALEVSGSFTVGTPFTLKVTEATANAPALILVGLGVECTPVLGVPILVPVPAFGVPGPPTTDANGELEVTGTWPAGVNPGTRLAFQAWYLDSGGGGSFVTSNLVFLASP